MPDKLTNTEVKKALEWHLNEVNHCDGCPLFVLKNTTTYCVDVLMQNALDLINRLETKNSNLTSDLTSLQKDLTSAKAENAELFKKIKKLQDEYRWLDQESDILAADVNVLNNSLKTATIEAYKECVEKVKEKSCKMNMCHNDIVVKTDYQISDESLDNLLNELVGDADGDN